MLDEAARNRIRAYGGQPPAMPATPAMSPIQPERPSPAVTNGMQPTRPNVPSTPPNQNDFPTSLLNPPQEPPFSTFNKFKKAYPYFGKPFFSTVKYMAPAVAAQIYGQYGHMAGAGLGGAIGGPIGAGIGGMLGRGAAGALAGAVHSAAFSPALDYLKDPANYHNAPPTDHWGNIKRGAITGGIAAYGPPFDSGDPGGWGGEDLAGFRGLAPINAVMNRLGLLRGNVQPHQIENLFPGLFPGVGLGHQMPPPPPPPPPAALPPWFNGPFR